MNKTTIPSTIATIGETLVVIGAAGWISQAAVMKYIFAIGAILMAIGRFATRHDAAEAGITLRRLYIQQYIGIIMLIIAAILMFIYGKIDGIEIGDHILRATPAAWLLPFMIFVAIELYTTLRIQAEHKKQVQK